VIKKSFLLIAILCCIVIWIPLSNASAKGLFEHQNTTVLENQAVDDVVVVGGDVTIHGTVNDSVIVLNGNLDLKATAKINGLIVVIGGSVQQEHGAVIPAKMINISFDNATKNSLLFGGGLMIGSWLLQLTVSVVFVLISVAIVYFSKMRLTLYVERVRKDTGHLVYIGFFSSLILLALTILLFVTVIGIPFGLLLLFIVVLAFLLGFAVLSLLIGEQIRGIHGRPSWFVTLWGSIFLTSFMNVPFIGGLLCIGVVLFSIGMTTLWILEWVKTRRSKTS
jgi:hypothetical protein